MSMITVPISIRLIFAPTAASKGNAEQRFAIDLNTASPESGVAIALEFFGYATRACYGIDIIVLKTVF